MIDAATVKAIALSLGADLCGIARDFSICNCHLCRSRCPRAAGARAAAWRKDFKPSP